MVYVEELNGNLIFQPIVNLKNGVVIGYEVSDEDEVVIKYNRIHKHLDRKNHEILQSQAWKNIRETAKQMEQSYKDKSIFIDLNNFTRSTKIAPNKEILNFLDTNIHFIYFEVNKTTCEVNMAILLKALRKILPLNKEDETSNLGKSNRDMLLFSKLKVEYISIGRDMVKGIDNDLSKQLYVKAIIASFSDLNIKTIAKGVENEKELLALMELGINFAQGNFIQQSSIGKVDSNAGNIKEYLSKNRKKIESTYSSNLKNNIGQITKRNQSFSSTSNCSDVKNYLDKNDYTGVCVVQGDKPTGLMMKHTLDSSLATQYGVSVFSRRPVMLLMDKSPLVVDFYDTVKEVSDAAMSRETEKVYDYVIVTKNSSYFGIVTIKDLLEYTIAFEKNYAMELNPLTGLPGNATIERTLSQWVETSKEFCILYFDLDNFKAYNDNYGFESGDKILKFTCDLIMEKLEKYFPSDNFLGHIGGDDFVALIRGNIEECKKSCEDIINKFDASMCDFFSYEDFERGYIESIGRNGNFQRFNITSISIAGLFIEESSKMSPEKIVSHVTTLKKQVKNIENSCYRIKYAPNN